MHETEPSAWEATRRAIEARRNEPRSVRRRPRLVWIVAATLILVPVLLVNFVAAPYTVSQDSVASTVRRGDTVLIDKVTPAIFGYSRGDIVLVKETGGCFLVACSLGSPAHLARVIGQPDDTVEFDNESVYVTSPAGPRQRDGAAPMVDAYVLRDPLDPSKGTIVSRQWCIGHWLLGPSEYFVMDEDLRGGHHMACPGGASYRDSFAGRVWR